jgi:thymidylate synthase (FAD)
MLYGFSVIADRLSVTLPLTLPPHSAQTTMKHEVHDARLISTSRLSDENLIQLFENEREHNVADLTELAESEFIVTYCARVSNPNNQQNIETAPRLLRYLMKHKHWSPLEMSNMVVEVETTRAIAAQILRHRSFSFQEFSQRYSSVDQLGTIGLPHLRSQDLKNKQASHDDLDPEFVSLAEKQIQQLYNNTFDYYEYMLSKGVAKECARSILPLGTPTRLYMNGTLRSWLHYLQARCSIETQDEHRLVACAIKSIFDKQFPTISEAAFS